MQERESERERDRKGSEDRFKEPVKTCIASSYSLLHRTINNVFCTAAIIPAGVVSTSASFIFKSQQKSEH